MLNLLNLAFSFKDSVIAFGRVESIETEPYISDLDASASAEEKEAAKEASTQFTGYVVITLYATNTPVKALWMVPVGGKSAFSGGIPEIGSTAVLLKTDKIFLIIGYVPVPINMLVATRKEMTSSVPGELLFQASTYDEKITDWYRGAFAKFDTYGRLIIGNGSDDLNIIYGPLLSNEYKSSVAVVRDVVTEEVVILSEKVKAYERRVDAAGNLIHKCLSSLWSVLGDDIRRVSGRYVLVCKDSLRLEADGSYIEFIPPSEEDESVKPGVYFRSMRDMFISSAGNLNIESSALLRLVSAIDIVLISSGSLVLKAMKEFLLVTNEKIVIKSLKGSGTLDFLGSALIKSGATVDLIAKLRINLGEATEPVMKGTATYEAIINHRHTGNLGYLTSSPLECPQTPSNLLLAQKLLSSKVFTE